MNIDQVTESVSANFGIKALQMGTLRDAHEGRWVRLSHGRAAEISAALRRRGYRHLPTELPTREDAYVYIYEQRSPIGAFVTLLGQPPGPCRGMELEHFARKLADPPDSAVVRAAA